MLQLLSPFIGPLISACVSGLLALATGWIKTQEDRQTGMIQQAAVTNAATVQTTVAVAQAEATAPKTLDDVITGLKAGTF
jgi:hypothetical protein